MAGKTIITIPFNWSRMFHVLNSLIEDASFPRNSNLSDSLAWLHFTLDETERQLRQQLNKENSHS